VGDPAFPKDAGQSRVIDVVKACFDVQKQGGHLQARPLQGFQVVYMGKAGIVCAQPREGAALVRVDQAPQAGREKEACRDYPFQDLRDGAEEYYYHEGGAGLVRGLSRLVEDHSVCHM